MNDVILQPLLAGFSTGLFCSTTCLPFIAPYLVSEGRAFRATLRIMLEFIGGRFIGYVLFGAVFGYLGERITGRAINTAVIVSMMLASWLLILYAAGVLKPAASLCGIRGFAGRGIPALMGLLMGVNVCPPFLLSVAYVFTLHSAWKGVAYFVVFFAATTLYFVPLVFLGFLGRMKEFQAAARVSALLVGLIFSAYGVFALTRGVLLVHTP
jgi:sulfite exporter TauE/SafE